MSYLALIADCWSRDFDHAEYLDYAARAAAQTKNKTHTVSKKAYILICQGLDLDMEENIRAAQAEAKPQLYPNGLMF